MMTRATETAEEVGAKTAPAEVEDADEAIRFRVITCIHWLRSTRTLELPADVQHAWNMSARAACEAIERLFRGDCR